MIALQHIADREKVAQALGHLLVVDVDKAVVHPEPRERHTMCCLALGNFILVVREDQILAAAVNVKRVAEVAPTHRRALDMPARTPASPWRLPCRLARLRSFPKGENLLRKGSFIIRHSYLLTNYYTALSILSPSGLGSKLSSR